MAYPRRNVLAVSSSLLVPLSILSLSFSLSSPFFIFSVHHPPFLALSPRLALARSGITWCTCMHACRHGGRMHACMHASRSEDGSTRGSGRDLSFSLFLSPFSLFFTLSSPSFSLFLSRLSFASWRRGEPQLVKKLLDRLSVPS